MRILETFSIPSDEGVLQLPQQVTPVAGALVAESQQVTPAALHATVVVIGPVVVVVVIGHGVVII